MIWSIRSTKYSWINMNLKPQNNYEIEVNYLLWRNVYLLHPKKKNESDNIRTNKPNDGGN